MLAKAVQKHAPLQGSKRVPSQQSRNPSNTLQPSPPAVLNAPPPSWPAAKNPLKRTASEAMGNWQSSNTATIPGRESSLSSSASGSRKSSVADISQSTIGGDRVGKLHDTVFFDENDFDDDANIDLDSETASMETLPKTDVSYPTLRPTTTSTAASKTVTGSADVTYPRLPPTYASPTSDRVPSSAPIPWSSSPLHHKLPAQPPLTPPTDHTNTVSKQAGPKVSKRRTLPWLADAGNEPNNQSGRPQPPPHVQALIERSRKRKAAGKESAVGAPAESFTPLPKDKPNSPFPWNKTASAVKKDQKAFREGHRKLIKDGVKDPNADQVGKSTSTKAKKVPRVFLSDEQRKVLDLVADSKKSVFFTGSAGTGKSVLLREIIKVLRDKHKRELDRVAVTASTGLAACNVGGVTLHSFAGIGLGKEAVPELVRKIKRNSKAKLRWMRTKVLIVDEISMVDGDLFDKLEGIARNIRNNGRPFGGIQLVITGDFFQLPPVPDYGKIAKFAFDAATWNTSIEHTIGLTQVFRQKDPVFANMLNEMRLGRLSGKSIDTFRTLNRPLNFQDDFQATELFPTRNEVEAANNSRMVNLGGKSCDFIAEDGGSILDKVQRDKMLSNCMAPQSISLKKGAQVMLIKNIDETLVNGSIGKVIAFMDEKMFDFYHEDEEEFQAVETMDINDENMSDSRKKLRAMISKDLAGDTGRKWPLVRFAISDGTSRDLLCQRESWKIELPNGEVQASRSQVPLILAWALSIHKAQGQTLERVKVDLGKIFEKGQAYVALSRATCQEGLQILRFDPKKVMAHDRVRSFYDSLYSVDEAPKASSSVAPKQKVAVKDYEEDFLKGAKCPEDDDEDALAEMYG